MRRLVALVAAVLVLAACGADQTALRRVDAAPTAEYLAASAQRTEAFETGRADVTLTLGGLPGTNGPVVVRATSAFDTGRRRASATVDLSALAALGSREGGGLPHGLAALATSVDAVVDGTSLYVKPGGLAQLLGMAAGKPWLRIDTSDLGEGSFPGLLTPTTVDPSALLEELRQAGVAVTEAGREDVRGVATTHYHGTVDLQEAGAGPVELDAWIDDTGIVRRAQASARLEDVTATFTAELYDLGAGVSIEVPPADAVADLGGLGDLAGLFGARPR
jgi:hypothetical protein